MNITLHRGAQNLAIAVSTPDDGSFDWDLPLFLPIASDYTIDVTSVSDPGITDTSDAEFSVQ